MFDISHPSTCFNKNKNLHRMEERILSVEECCLNMMEKKVIAIAGITRSVIALRAN